MRSFGDPAAAASHPTLSGESRLRSLSNALTLMSFAQAAMGFVGAADFYGTLQFSNLDVPPSLYNSPGSAEFR
jgi:hypothetical protein